MYEDLKEQAVKNLKKQRVKKRAVFIVGLIFAAVSALLYTISLNFDPFVAYWIKFPIMILALVFAIIYFSVFGFPFLGDGELTDEEIEREIVKIYRLEGTNRTTTNESDELELREIEALKNKWEDDEEYV
jgi:SNF family Na+-dependent transporter